MLHRPLVAMLLVGLVAAACGGGAEGGGGAPTETLSREDANRYFSSIDRLLDQAVAAHERGETDQAAELAGEAYLENFEHLEPALEERNAQLKEDLEELMGPAFRQEIQRGMSQEDLEARVAEAKQLLQQAKRALGVA